MDQEVGEGLGKEGPGVLCVQHVFPSPQQHVQHRTVVGVFFDGGVLLLVVCCCCWWCVVVVGGVLLLLVVCCCC